MATTQATDNNTVGTTDAQTTNRTYVASLVAGQTRLVDEWVVFDAIASASQDTIHRVADTS